MRLIYSPFSGRSPERIAAAAQRDADARKNPLPVVRYRRGEVEPAWARKDLRTDPEDE